MGKLNDNVNGVAGFLITCQTHVEPLSDVGVIISHFTSSPVLPVNSLFNLPYVMEFVVQS